MVWFWAQNALQNGTLLWWREEIDWFVSRCFDWQVWLWERRPRSLISAPTSDTPSREMLHFHHSKFEKLNRNIIELQTNDFDVKFSGSSRKSSLLQLVWGAASRKAVQKIFQRAHFTHFLYGTRFVNISDWKHYFLQFAVPKNGIRVESGRLWGRHLNAPLDNTPSRVVYLAFNKKSSRKRLMVVLATYK